MIFEDLDRIVFAGDSVTDMGSKNPIGEHNDDLGRGYVRLVDSLLAAAYPQTLVRVTNAGISGNTSRALLERWERDVLDLHPQWVSICIGINDVWRQFDSPARPDKHVQPEEYEANLRQMLDSLEGRVKGTFLMTPYYMEPNPQDAMRARMDTYSAICKKLAAEYGCRFIDLQKVFADYCSVRHSTFVAWDRVHPNQVGAMLIARAFLRCCEFDFEG